MALYIYQQKAWPVFTWNEQTLSQSLGNVRFTQGRIAGRMEALGFSVREDAMLKALTQEVLKSTEIEGESLNAEQVRSSIARRLGLEVAGLIPSDRHVDGVVAMILDANQNIRSL